MSEMTLKDIPPEHRPLVFNSLICERLLNFTRTFDKDSMAYHWSGTGEDGEQRTTLFEFATDAVLAQDMLRRFVDANGLSFTIVRVPHVPDKVARHWIVQLGQADAGGNPMGIGEARGPELAQAICLLVCIFIKADIFERHRELFPGSYLAANN